MVRHSDRELAEPVLSDDIQARELDREVRAELRSLGKTAAESVARRLVATGELLDVEPKEALAHALVARRQASRIAAVREAVGIAAYHAGEWQTAIAELRAYHRMAGKQTHIAVLADCERALGRPERAVDMFRHADRKVLGVSEWVELLIVASGARRDMGQVEASVTMLQVPELRSTAREPWLVRLTYAYAEALLAAGREDEAATWFERTVTMDPDGETGAADRLLELQGIEIEGDLTDDDDELQGTEIEGDLADDERSETDDADDEDDETGDDPDDDEGDLVETDLGTGDDDLIDDDEAGDHLEDDGEAGDDLDEPGEAEPANPTAETGSHHSGPTGTDTGSVRADGGPTGSGSSDGSAGSGADASDGEVR